MTSSISYPDDRPEFGACPITGDGCQDSCRIACLRLNERRANMTETESWSQWADQWGLFFVGVERGELVEAE